MRKKGEEKKISWQVFEFQAVWRGVVAPRRGEVPGGVERCQAVWRGVVGCKVWDPGSLFRRGFGVLVRVCFQELDQG
jgi:hypothetical protein